MVHPRRSAVPEYRHTIFLYGVFNNRFCQRNGWETALDEAGGITNKQIAPELKLPPVKLHCRWIGVAYLQPDLASESACGHAYCMLAANAIKMAIADIRTKKTAKNWGTLAFLWSWATALAMVMAMGRDVGAPVRATCAQVAFLPGRIFRSGHASYKQCILQR